MHGFGLPDFEALLEHEQAELADGKKARNIEVLKATGLTILTAASVHYHGDVQSFTNQLDALPAGDFIADKIPFIGALASVFSWTNAGFDHYRTRLSRRRVESTEDVVTALRDRLPPVVLGEVISSAVEPLDAPLDDDAVVYQIYPGQQED